MCERVYLPICLLKVGLFMLIKMDSLMVLPSLLTMLKLSNVVTWPVVDWRSCICEGALRCFLNLSPKVLVASHIYSALHSSILLFYQYVISLLLYFSLSLGVTRMFLSVILPLKYNCMPYLW